jgi:hypothetical protein
MSTVDRGYARIIRNCRGISPWIAGMGIYVNDQITYRVEQCSSYAPWIPELGYYFPKEALRFLSKAEEFAYLNGGLRVVKI